MFLGIYLAGVLTTMCVAFVVLCVAAFEATDSYAENPKKLARQGIKLVLLGWAWPALALYHGWRGVRWAFS